MGWIGVSSGKVNPWNLGSFCLVSQTGDSREGRVQARAVLGKEEMEKKKSGPYTENYITYHASKNTFF